MEIIVMLSTILDGRSLFAHIYSTGIIRENIKPLTFSSNSSSQNLVNAACPWIPESFLELIRLHPEKISLYKCTNFSSKGGLLLGLLDLVDPCDCCIAISVISGQIHECNELLTACHEKQFNQDIRYILWLIPTSRSLYTWHETIRKWHE